MPAPQPSPEQRRQINKVAAGIMATLLATGGATAALDQLLDREEGNRTTAYQDMVGKWTICRGVTHNVRPGETRTSEECHKINSAEAKQCLAAVDRAFVKRQPENVRVAFCDFAYNVGEHAFLNSTARRLVNRDHLERACDELPKWVYVGDRVVQWQVERRGIEQVLCRWQIDHPDPIKVVH